MAHKLYSLVGLHNGVRPKDAYSVIAPHLIDNTNVPLSGFAIMAPSGMLVLSLLVLQTLTLHKTAW
jgi:hypothetical protein